MSVSADQDDPLASSPSSDNKTIKTQQVEHDKVRNKVSLLEFSVSVLRVKQGSAKTSSSSSSLLSVLLLLPPHLQSVVDLSPSLSSSSSSSSCQTVCSVITEGGGAG